MEFKHRIGRFLPHAVKFHGRRLLHFGKAVGCPLCGSSVRFYGSHGGLAPVVDELDVVGGMKRSYDRCPVCNGKDRTRLLYLYLFTEADVANRSYAILHLAPEFGLYLRMSRLNRLDYVCADIEPREYAFARNILLCDARHMAFPDDRFDIVIAAHVMEHIEDDQQALREMFRVLRKGGIALLMVPMSLRLHRTLEDPRVQSEEERLRRFGQHDHVRIYARDFEERVARAGFQLQPYRAAEQRPDAVKALKLNPLETLYVALKPTQPVQRAEVTDWEMAPEAVRS